MRFKLIILWVVLLPIVLASCGPRTDSQQGVTKRNPTATHTPSPKNSPTPHPSITPTPIPTSALGISPESLKGAKVTVWHVWSGPTGNTVDALIEEFNLSNPWGISVEALAVGNFDDLDERIRHMNGLGAGPAVTTAYISQALNWPHAQDLLVDLQIYIDDPEWGITLEERQDFSPWVWNNTFQQQTAFIGMPVLRSGAVLYYNSSWAQELGFSSPPKSAEELRQQACAAAQANQNDSDPANDGTGGLIVSTDYTAILSWLLAFGDPVAHNESYIFDTPAGEDAFRFLRSLYDEGCAWLNEAASDTTAFISRQGLFAVGTIANIPNQEALFADASSSDNWSVLPFPGPAGESAMTIYGPALILHQTDPTTQLASWLFIKWMVQPKNQGKLAQASAYLPVRVSSKQYLDTLIATYPQWLTALDNMETAYDEPSFASWHTARWAVSDAATQLFRYYFTIDQVPGLLKLLEETANEFQANGP